MKNQPNILLITVDQMRFDLMGCAGNPYIQTQHLNKLAQLGTHFTSAYSTCPICVPARRTLMTGLSPYGIRMDRNRDSQPFTEGPKLAEVLSSKGYHCFAVGKLHTHPQRNRLGFGDVILNEEGRHQSIERDDYEYFLEEHGYAHQTFQHGLGNNQYGARPSNLPENMTETYWTGIQAQKFIERRDPDKPFFLYVSFTKPHPPLTPPQVYWDMYKDAPFIKPALGDWVKNKTPFCMKSRADNHNLSIVNDQIITDSHRGMYALISQIDHQIGALVGQLREKKLLNNTLIIFHSDHGDMLFDHNNVAKALPFEGSAHIPFIVVPPEQSISEITAHRKCAEPVCIEDIMPTILDYCGVPIPNTVEGKSLRPQIEKKKLKRRDYIHMACVGNHALTNGKIKYCWFGADGTELLFNLDKDPRECKDLSTNFKHQPLLKEWRSKLIRELTKRKDPVCIKGKLVPHPVKEAKNIRWLNQFIWNNRGWDH